MAAVSTRKANDADYFRLWQQYCDEFRKAAPVDHSETKAQQLVRIRRLEGDAEAWFKFYFPNYCTAEPAKFHKAATKRLLAHAEWYEVRAWSRELAKSARSMMEMCYLAMTGKIHNVLLVSNSSDNAERLLLPFKAFFENNQRLIHDYGIQTSIGNWKASEFTIRKGCSFRALGWGQSPRGTRKDNVRPDFILIDDIDTDEECRNEEIMKNKVNWIEQALIATRSISCPTRVLVNGNIIHDNCAVNSLGKKADKFSIVNVRDENGKSTWPEKNSEEDIDRVLSIISYESVQKEYFNNPMDGSDTFRDLTDGKVPPLRECLCEVYADPATSNKDVSSGSMKAIGIIAKKGLNYYIVKVRLDTMSNDRFVQYLFDLYDYCIQHKAKDVRVHIENNTLQDPFFQQVIMPAIYERCNATKTELPVLGDGRNKGDKYTRIEGTLEPINRQGRLIFNETEKEEPNMQRLKAQFRNFSRKQKRMDGPDMVEGGVFLLREREAVSAIGSIDFIKRSNNRRYDS